MTDVDRNPAGIGLIELIEEDFRTHDSDPLEPGFWALLVHRLGNARFRVRTRLLRAPLSVACNVGYHAVLWGFGIKLSYTVTVGRRVRIWHHGGMVLGARSIGDDVQIRQNTTFGVAHRSRPHDKPVIEDGVDVGCGAVVLGDVRVGRDSVIGANAVVTRDTPPRSVVVGVPGRVIRFASTPAD